MVKAQNIAKKVDVPNRKLKRAAMRKQVKMKRAIRYANGRNTEKVCVSSKDVKFVNSVLGSEFNIALKGKSFTNKESSNLTKSLKKSKKNKKKKKKVAETNENNLEDTEIEDSFKIVNSINERISKLQQYVDSEAQKIPKDEPTDESGEEDESLDDIRIGQAQDNKEINELSRKLHLNAHQKKKMHPTYRDDFETLLGDIESGNMTNSETYKDTEIFNSDDEFDDDFNRVFGHDDESIMSSENSNSEKDEGTDEEGDDDESDEEEENEFGRDFLDDEAMEDNEHYESNTDSECSEDLAFGSGSSVSSSKYAKQGSANGSVSTDDIFEDGRSSESDESDLDGFVVGNDEISFETEDSDNLSELELACEISEDKSNGKHAVNGGVKSILKKSKNSKPVKKEIKKLKKRKRVSFIPSTDESEDTGNSPCKTTESAPAVTQEVHEDIYGRLRDKSGNILKSDTQEVVGKKYIPPALRKLNALNMGEEKQKQLAELTRSLKGLLNKLSESNLANIAKQVEAFYHKNSRNDINEVLTRLLITALISPVLTNERLIQEHALLVAILSAHVDFEVGAHILSEFVVKWNEKLDNYIPADDESDTKELDNFIQFIVHLYTFNVVDATLIYGILTKLSKTFLRKEIELILLILRSVGFTLRKDNPILLKEFITSIQKKATEMSVVQHEETYSKVKFMLEILVALRNNNIAKMPNYDPSHGQRLKALLKSILRKGCCCSSIKVSLDDLLRSQTSGKWWLVGFAWSGEAKEQQKDKSELMLRSSKYGGLCDESCFSDELKTKAEKLHLGRQPRISIFYILTEGSEDVDEAFDKILHLKLPQNQNKEIFSVLFICLLRGKVYNPFFSCLVNKLSSVDRKLKYHFQKCLWDQFKELPNVKASYISNLSKFSADIIADGEINISILGYDLFMNPSQSVISFIRQTLMTLMIHSKGVSAISTAFSHLLKPQLNTLRQCFKLFISKFINTKDKEDGKAQILDKRKKMVLEILSSGDGFSL